MSNTEMNKHKIFCDDYGVNMPAVNFVIGSVLIIIGSIISAYYGMFNYIYFGLAYGSAAIISGYGHWARMENIRKFEKLEKRIRKLEELNQK